eukprot:CAMPEP_0113484918 /NCGR_PEP_ID=MMETSP0014_2-20120614/24214_1 /TAXON_ID=2857 /ORGANISM="Nitzschia sp." /LENGTH=646 /DNA_ID=CAMNT_0000378545 /DNA_START=56 /DNA_END=1996 /DNA_ORIENTATION=+ /assembly_acc=CAM_ASM_000159
MTIQIVSSGGNSSHRRLAHAHASAGYAHVEYDEGSSSSRRILLENDDNDDIQEEEDDDNLYLIFTTTQSEELLGGGSDKPASFEGIYTCKFSRSEGKCIDPPMVVVNTFGEMEHTHLPHHGIDVMNIQFVQGSNGRTTPAGRQEKYFYAGYYSGKRDSFEILRADVSLVSEVTGQIKFQSFFRTQKSVWKNDDAVNPMTCEHKDNMSVGDTYLKVHPRDFVVVISESNNNNKNDSNNGENGGSDVYISWDGFYQNCSDEFSAKKGLMWTVGVSKLIQSQDCTLTDGMDEAKFEDCTEVVAIAYQDTKAYESILGYAGINYSKLPNGDNLFFLSALDHVNLDQKHLGKTKLYNELWVIKEGQDYSKDPSVRQVFGRVEIDPAFMDVPCDDVGSIQLRKHEGGGTMATGICRSAYDAGIFCNSIDISDEGLVTIQESSTFVTKKQITESCTVYKSEHYKQTQYLNAVSTGIAVLWDEDSPGHKPHLVTFGCYGEINYHGNTTTVFDDGTTVRAIPGAYPGSLFFGPDLHHEEPPKPGESFIPQNNPSLPSVTTGSGSGTGLLSFSNPLVIAAVTVVALTGIVIFKKKKNRYSRYGRYGSRFTYSGIGMGDQNDTVSDEAGIGQTSTGAQYVELSMSPSRSDGAVIQAV